MNLVGHTIFHIPQTLNHKPSTIVMLFAHEYTNTQIHKYMNT